MFPFYSGPWLDARANGSLEVAQPLAAAAADVTTDDGQERAVLRSGAAATASHKEQPGLTAKDEGALLTEQPEPAFTPEDREPPFAELDELRTLVADGKERGYPDLRGDRGVPRGGRRHQGAGAVAPRPPRRERDRGRVAGRQAGRLGARQGRGRGRRAEGPGRAEEGRDRPDGRAVARLAAPLPALDRSRRAAHRRRGGRRSRSASSAATWGRSSRWWRRTCGWSCRSRRATSGAGSRSST